MLPIAGGLPSCYARSVGSSGQSESRYLSEEPSGACAGHFGSSCVAEPTAKMWVQSDREELAAYAAFRGMLDCGPAALPVLRTMLADDEIAPWHWRCVQVLAEIGKADVETDLVQLAHGEMAYWAKLAPTVKLFDTDANGDVKVLTKQYAHSCRVRQRLSRSCIACMKREAPPRRWS